MAWMPLHSEEERTMRQKTAYLGLFTAFALIASYIESLIPFSFGIPGIKLGLTNIVVVLVLYLMGPREALGVSAARILLAGFLFGNLYSILYSLAGGLVSFLVMVLMKRWKRLSMVGVSIAGGVSHNIGQIAVAVFVVENIHVAYYLPALLIAGAVTGLLIGIAAREVLRRVDGRLWNHSGPDRTGRKK